MAETRPVDPFNVDYPTVEAHRRPVYRRISLLNGLLIGLALGLGAWGLEMWRIITLPVVSYMPSLWLGVGAVVALCGLVGWLTGRLANTALTVVLWALAGGASMMIMGYLPYYGRTLAVWLLDPRFRGSVVYPYTLEGGPGGLLLGGLLIILVLVILGFMQNYRLEQIAMETNRNGRLNGRAWVSLLLPMPIVFLAGVVTQSVMSNPAAPAIVEVNRAVTVAQGYEGDLRTLELNDGISYAALQPVREIISGDFTLSVVDVNPLNATVIVGVDFSGDGWIYCRVINDQLSFCYDASPAYFEGLRNLVTGEPLPEDCRGCALRATDEATAFLLERRELFGPDPEIARVGQQGSHVLMRVTGDNLTAECRIAGVTPMQLTECEGVGD